MSYGPGFVRYLSARAGSAVCEARELEGLALHRIENEESDAGSAYDCARAAWAEAAGRTLAVLGVTGEGSR